LGEILSVRRELVDPPESPAFFNNKPAIILSVSTVEGTNNVEFGDRLTALLDDIQQDLPIGYVLEPATFQPKLIAAAVNSAVSNVYQTLIIVLVVVMVFLGLRTGLIVGFFVPLTMLFGIIIMSLVGVELQRMSIAATIISLGMLVDNGIVVAEDIRVRLARGAARRDAATESGRALAIPLLTSSLTTIFAFMPMMFIDGGAGEYVRSLAQVVTILLLGSWLLSMTVTPAMCAWFMRVPENSTPREAQPEAAYDGFVYLLYRRALGAILKWRLIAIAGLVGLLILSVSLLGTIRNEFFPLGDRSQFLVYLDFEAGTDIRETQTQLRTLTSWLADKDANPEITNHVAYVGYGGPRFFLSLSPVDRDPQRAFVLINTQTFDDVGPVLDRVNTFLDSKIPGARADAKRMWFGGTEPGVLQIRLIGPDGDTLVDRAERVIAALHDVPGAVGVKQDWENKILTLVVDVDQVRARRTGVTSTDVAESLNTVFAGYAISDYREGDKSIPIVVRGDELMRLSLSSLQRIQVYSPTINKFIALEQVATVRPEWRFSRVKRRNQQRTLTVEARNVDISTTELLAAVTPTLDALDLPTGYRMEIGGEIKDQSEANEKLFGFLPVAIAAIIILLIGQFNSFRKGGVILATVPLILIGGTLGLLVMDAANGFMVLLGFFSLAGILINNGIVLVDRISA
jgi:multidrug efflux pump subunit AcrB